MIKLTILNLREFLDVVNRCDGDVYVIRPGSGKENIRGDGAVPDELWEQYRRCGNCLPMELEITMPKDYLRIVNYYAGDC